MSNDLGDDAAAMLTGSSEPVRLTALRLALAHSGNATAALIDMEAALRDAGSPGLAWDAAYLTDRVDAIAGVVALQVKAEGGRTVPTDRGQVSSPG